jgi:hypothetical protein
MRGQSDTQRAYLSRIATGNLFDSQMGRRPIKKKV